MHHLCSPARFWKSRINRQDYGEVRIQTIGTLAGRLVMVVWTPRGKARRIVSMRYCNDRERNIYGPRIPQ